MKPDDSKRQPGTLYADLMATGAAVDNHESDLYIEDTPAERGHDGVGFVVEYDGLLSGVRRWFPTRSRAEQWARQVGQWPYASITQASEHNTAPPPPYER